MSGPADNDVSPAWDEDLAVYAPGKSIVISLTYVNAAGEVQKQTQMHGVVESADRESGFVVALRGTEEGNRFNLPADCRSFRLADQGRYELYGSGDIIVDPDLISAWTLTSKSEV